MGRSRDIADMLGKTELVNTNNERLITAFDTVDSAYVSSNVTPALVFYSTLDSLPVSGLSVGQQAYVSANNRLYISDGSGWYNKALITLSPAFDSINPTFTIVDSSTPLIITNTASDSDTPSAGLTYSGVASDSAQYLANITNDSSVWTFTPLSADSVFNNATLGNLTDSTGGDFTYTFRVSDGVNLGTKNITINYNITLPVTGESVTITNTSVGSGGFYIYTNTSIDNVPKLLSWRNALRSGGTTSDPNPGGNLQVVFFNGSTPVYGAAQINPYIGGSTTKIFGIDTMWDVVTGKFSSNYGLLFDAYGSNWTSCTVDGTSYSNGASFTFNSIKVYNGTNNTVTTSSDSPIAEYAATLDNDVMVPYTTDLIYYADATNYTKSDNRWYNIAGSVLGHANGFGGSGLTVDEEGGSGLNSRAQLNGTTSTTWAPSNLTMTANQYTLFGVMGYPSSGGTIRRILQASSGNWLSGFWNGLSGVAFHEGWITQSSTSTHGRNMIYFTDQDDLFRSNGVDRTTSTGSRTTNIDLRINTGGTYGTSESSDFRISEILIYNTELTSAQIAQVESYLATKYNL